jgi:hypothetical protein
LPINDDLDLDVDALVRISASTVLFMLFVIVNDDDDDDDVGAFIIIITSDRGFGPALSGHTSSPLLLKSTPVCLPVEFSDKVDFEALPV